MVCPLSLNDFFIAVKVVNDAVDSIFVLERIFGRFENEVVRYDASFIEVYSMLCNTKAFWEL